MWPTGFVGETALSKAWMDPELTVATFARSDSHGPTSACSTSLLHFCTALTHPATEPVPGGGARANAEPVVFHAFSFRDPIVCFGYRSTHLVSTPYCRLRTTTPRVTGVCAVSPSVEPLPPAQSSDALNSAAWFHHPHHTDAHPNAALSLHAGQKEMKERARPRAQSRCEGREMDRGSDKSIKVVTLDVRFIRRCSTLRTNW